MEINIENIEKSQNTRYNGVKISSLVGNFKIEKLELEKLEACVLQSAFLHTNFNVFDLEKSLAFYEDALGLKECRRITAKDGSFIIVFLEDGATGYRLELTWMRDRKQPYNLGDNEIHLAVRVSDKKEAYALHKSMGCICYENHEMDLYFINDPDGYWIEILDH